MNLYDWTGVPLEKPPDRIMASVTAVIRDAGRRILLQHRSDNLWWALPGGKVEIGESVEQAVIREVYEETGLQVSVERLIGVYSDPANFVVARYPEGATVHYVSICFECLPQSGEPRGSEEGTEVQWFNLDDLPERLLPGHRIRLNDALARRPGAFVR